MKLLFKNPIHGEGSGHFSAEVSERVLSFHESLPEYEKTRLVSLTELSKSLGVASVQIKDESSRFGLNAFKALGGSYCIASYLAKRFDIPTSELCFERLCELRESGALRDICVVTATDGNHGRGLAHAAKSLGISCVVYMPKGSAIERLENIRAEGAEAEILPLNYDDSVRYANEMAKKNGWILMQDTTVEGAYDAALWIMQGYTTMAAEISRQWQGEPPTHIFLQAGVGAMAGAMSACLSDYYKNAAPKICIVEAEAADCIYKTAEADDGGLHFVGGELDTMMAGLACGEPCELGWDEIKNAASCFISAEDEIAALGMRSLALPLGEDERIVSGESGAVTTGALIELCRSTELKAKLGISAESRVLLLSTEGATDRENYYKITGIRA